MLGGVPRNLAGVVGVEVDLRVLSHEPTGKQCLQRNLKLVEDYRRGGHVKGALDPWILIIFVFIEHVEAKKEGMVLCIERAMHVSISMSAGV